MLILRSSSGSSSCCAQSSATARRSADWPKMKMSFCASVLLLGRGCVNRLATKKCPMPLSETLECNAKLTSTAKNGYFTKSVHWRKLETANIESKMMSTFEKTERTQIFMCMVDRQFVRKNHRTLFEGLRGWEASKRIPRACGFDSACISSTGAVALIL